MTPEQALERLLAGNARFAAGELRSLEGLVEQRAKLSRGQEPFAAVLACYDSRVTPELVFDQGLGNLFVCRVAGNTVDDLVLGSIEYAVTSFELPLVVVLGHTSCAAITGALALNGPAPGKISAVVDALALQPGTSVDDAARANARAAAQRIAESELIAGQGTRVVAALYSLESGIVTLL